VPALLADLLARSQQERGVGGGGKEVGRVLAKDGGMRSGIVLYAVQCSQDVFWMQGLLLCMQLASVCCSA
jgi:hypothetical protein